MQQEDLQSCWIPLTLFNPTRTESVQNLGKKKIIKLLLFVYLYLALSMQFSRTILIRLLLIQDTDTRALTRGAPKSRWDTQIHNLHFKAHKYILLMSLSKTVLFVMYKEKRKGGESVHFIQMPNSCAALR